MSSESDQYVVEAATTAQNNEALMKAKKWVYSVDSNSSGGVFGQEIQFDLGALGSQGDWTYLAESQIDVGVFTGIQSTNAVFATTAATYSIDKDLTVLKNGSHHFVSQAALSINGKMLQDFQSNLNVATHADIMTTYSQDEMNKWAHTLHMSKRPEAYDDIENTADDAILTAGGVNILNATHNESLRERMYAQNNKSGALFATIGNSTGAGHSVVQVKNNGTSSTAAAVTAGEYVYAKFDTITIRLKDICPCVKSLPPIKNIRGYLYLKMNAITVNFTTAAATSAAITLSTPTSLAGSFCPVQLVKDNLLSAGVANAAGAFTLTCEPRGVNPSTTLTTPKPAHVNARLITPKYEANPAVDAALSMKKTFTVLERRTNTVSLAQQQGNTFNINAGVPNPRFVRVYPFFTGKGDAKKSDGTTDIVLPTTYNPFMNLKDSAGSITSPMAQLTNFNVYVGNKAVFQDPQNFDYEQFSQEVVKCGLNGGMDSQVSSGLIDATLWSRFYRYYVADVSRRLSSETGNLKSIQVQAFNSTKLPLQLIVDTYSERQHTIDTALCEFV